jgi:membrane-associated phospholipid phosphatase
MILAALVLVTVLLDVWAVTQVRHLPERVVVVFDVITDFGKSGWFLFPLGGCLITIAAVSPLLPRASMLVLASVAVRVGFLFTAIAVPGLFTTVIKHVIGRARPYVTGVADAYAYSPFNWRVEYASFPSGHATTALAAAVAIGTIWPRARVVMWIYAIGIAVSRVVVTSHYPSDVMPAPLWVFWALCSCATILLRADWGSPWSPMAACMLSPVHRFGVSKEPSGICSPDRNLLTSMIRPIVRNELRVHP